MENARETFFPSLFLSFDTSQSEAKKIDARANERHQMTIIFRYQWGEKHRKGQSKVSFVK